MGQKTSKLSNQDIQEIKLDTGFSIKEIKQWYKGFSRDIGATHITRNDFIGLHHQFYPFGDCTKFASYTFDAFDMDNNGQLTFAEFIKGLSIVSRGTTKEKLDWTFRLYDRDSDGKISFNDLNQVISSIYEMVGTKSITYGNDVKTPEMKSLKIFEMYGKGKNDFIKKEEWIDPSNLSEDADKALNIYSGLI